MYALLHGPLYRLSPPDVKEVGGRFECGVVFSCVVLSSTVRLCTMAQDAQPWSPLCGVNRLSHGSTEVHDPQRTRPCGRCRLLRVPLVKFLKFIQGMH